MKLIRKTKITITKSGNKISWGVFECPFCLQEVERQLSNGYKQKSCGCIANQLRSQALSGENNPMYDRKGIKNPRFGKEGWNKGKKQTEEVKQKIRESHLGMKVSEETKQKISLANKGKKRTEEQRKKLSEAKKGKKYTLEHRQNISKGNKGKSRGKGENNPMFGVSRFGLSNPFYGKKHTEKTKLKNSKYHKKLIGELSSNWNNGSSFEPYAPEFNKEKKQFILERDNYTCQTPNCINTENLHIHHIDYDKQNNLDENLVTLCNSCHSKTNGKNKRPFWTEFYQNIMINRIVECLL